MRAILGQQVTVKGATTLAGRLVRAFGRPTARGNGLTHYFPKADDLVEAKLTSVGLPRARAETIRAFARAVRDGQIRFEGNVEALGSVRELDERSQAWRPWRAYAAMYLWNVGEPVHVERARKRVAIAGKNVNVQKRDMGRR